MNPLLRLAAELNVALWWRREWQSAETGTGDSIGVLRRDDTGRLVSGRHEVEIVVDWPCSHHVDDDLDQVQSTLEAALDEGPLIVIPVGRNRPNRPYAKLFENVARYRAHLSSGEGSLTGEWWAGIAREVPRGERAIAIAALYQLKQRLDSQRVRRGPKHRRSNDEASTYEALSGPFTLSSSVRLVFEGEEVLEVIRAYPQISLTMEIPAD